MAWLEIISIRAVGVAEAAKVLEFCRESFPSIDVDKLLKLTVYTNARYSTDISIHLQWESDPGPMSILAGEVSSAVADLGLISHTLWMEREEIAAAALSPASAQMENPPKEN